MQPTSPDYGRVSAALAYLCLHLPEILDALGEDTASLERLRSLLDAVGRVVCRSIIELCGLSWGYAAW